MTPVLALLDHVLLSPVLTQQQPPPNAPEFGGSSPIGLVVIVLLFIAMGLLIRSMNTHLRKVPASFDKPDETGQAEPAEGRSDDGPDGSDGSSPGAGTEGRPQDSNG